MTNLHVGARVRYVGPSGGGDVKPGDLGTVLIARDHNGDAHIDFEGSAVGVWSLIDQEHLELVRDDNS